MQRVISISVGIAVVAWVGSVTAQPTPLGDRVELDDNAAVRPLSTTLRSGFHDVTSIASFPVGDPHGSGLEDDAPVRPLSVFLLSGLEGVTSIALIPVGGKYGSGLEDDAPVRPPNVFLQSGLEEMSFVAMDPSNAIATSYEPTRRWLLAD